MAWPFGPDEVTQTEVEKNLTTWTVQPRYKKSIEERELWSKDGEQIVRVTGWRGGSWTVTTNDGNPPEFEFTYVPGGDGNCDSIDMNFCCSNNIEECEMNETWDGWYGDVQYPDDMDDDEQERLNELWEEEFYDGWESDGWSNDDTEMWIWGDIEILNEAGDLVKVIRADEDGNVVDVTDDAE